MYNKQEITSDISFVIIYRGKINEEYGLIMNKMIKQSYMIIYFFRGRGENEHIFV